MDNIESGMKLLLKILIPVLIFVGSVFAAKLIVERRPEAQTRPSFTAVQAVDATKLSKSDYQVVLQSQGTVKPGRESSLVPEVTGIVRILSPKFLVGESFSAGDVLLEIDGRDYEIALAQAEARYAQASATLQEEKARSAQAQADWKSLGRKGKPSSLTARIPQVAAARANLAAAKAEIEKAQLDLERTRIIASYDGRVLEKKVDEGEFVSRGATLGRIYSVSRAEIRLPLSNRQRRFLSLSQVGVLDQSTAPKVKLSADIGGEFAVWDGRIVRSEGMDTNTQQLTVVAEIDDPFVSSGDRPAVQTGQFVSAEITGELLEGVFVIPRSALREDKEVLVVDEESRLRKAEVVVAWSDNEVAAITEGLKEGEVLVLTALGAVTNGTDVRATIDGVAPPRGQKGSATQGKWSGKKTAADGADVNGDQPSKTARPTDRASDAPADSEGGGGDRAARMARYKKMVDSGEELPAEVKARLRERLQAGAPLPQWLQDAIK